MARAADAPRAAPPHAMQHQLRHYACCRARYDASEAARVRARYDVCRRAAR